MDKSIEERELHLPSEERERHLPSFPEIQIQLHKNQIQLHKIQLHKIQLQILRFYSKEDLS